MISNFDHFEGQKSRSQDCLKIVCKLSGLKKLQTKKIFSHLKNFRGNTTHPPTPKPTHPQNSSALEALSAFSSTSRDPRGEDLI